MRKAAMQDALTAPLAQLQAPRAPAPRAPAPAQGRPAAAAGGAAPAPAGNGSGSGMSSNGARVAAKEAVQSQR